MQVFHKLKDSLHSLFYYLKWSVSFFRTRQGSGAESTACFRSAPQMFPWSPGEHDASSRQVHRKRAAEALARLWQGSQLIARAALGMHSLGRFAQLPWDGEKVPRAKIRIHGQRETGEGGNQKSLTPPGEVLMSGLGFHTTEGAPSPWLKNSGT